MEDNRKLRQLRDRERKKRDRAELRDTYIKKLLCKDSYGLKPKDMPDELVECKRALIKLGRLIKKKQE